VNIPVIANGDVRTVADIARIKSHTGCEAVMIGRAAVGNPWIFSRQDRADVPLESVRAMILAHLDRMLAFYGPERGLILFRKHANRYISPYRIMRQQRVALLTAEGPDDFMRALDTIYAGPPMIRSIN
jgi:tRNA-dihydrouridine synthase